jgi:hypothetical protein
MKYSTYHVYSFEYGSVFEFLVMVCFAQITSESLHSVDTFMLNLFGEAAEHLITIVMSVTLQEK